MIILDDLDKKALDHFRGFVVKKDLVGIVKGGANVPAFVLEYLLANTCSTDNEEKLKEGIENVKKILRDHYINPEESTLIQSKLRQKGRYKIIDKISVELDSQRDRYWANISNSNIKKANIGDELVRNHEKLMLGGIWAIIEMEYDPMITIGSTVYPFVVRDIKPIQLSSFDTTRIADKRKEFSKAEWKTLLLRSAGYEPFSEGLDERKLSLLLCRLVPLVEANFNMVELGPRASGKSYIYLETTPYALVVSGGQGTVAQLFVNNTTGRIGAVGLMDAICFDESTDKLFPDFRSTVAVEDLDLVRGCQHLSKAGQRCADDVHPPHHLVGSAVRIDSIDDHRNHCESLQPPPPRHGEPAGHFLEVEAIGFSLFLDFIDQHCAELLLRKSPERVDEQVGLPGDHFRAGRFSSVSVGGTEALDGGA